MCGAVMRAGAHRVGEACEEHTCPEWWCRPRDQCTGGRLRRVGLPCLWVGQGVQRRGLEWGFVGWGQGAEVRDAYCVGVGWGG